MSVTVSLEWALLRCGTIALLAIPVASCVTGFLRGLGRRARGLGWSLLFVPFLTPVIVVGYGWSSFALSLVRHPAWNEMLYDVVVILRLVPVAVLVLRYAPRLLSEESLHCRRLLAEGEGTSAGLREVRNRVLFFLHGPLRTQVVAVAVVFLLAFGEFEIASLLGIRTWTVVLFDAHAGGLQLGHSLRLALWPALIQTGVLLAVCGILFGSRRRPDEAAQSGESPGGAGRFWQKAASAGYLGFGVMVVTVVPLALVLRQTSQGFRVMAGNFVLGKPMGWAVVFGLAGGALAYLAAGVFSEGRRLGGGMRGRLLAAFVLAVPGLLGPLVLSLAMLYLFQLPVLRTLLDTPVPLMLTLGVLLFPVGLLLRVLLHTIEPAEGLHEARLLSASGSARVRQEMGELVWHMRGRVRLYVGFLLFSLAYFDMTSAAVLAPAGQAPMFVWLYNLMHYGQSAVLSAMVCAAFLAPIAGLGLILTGRRVLARLGSHG